MPVKNFTFCKAAGCRPATLLKINSFAGVFLRIMGLNSQNTFSGLFLDSELVSCSTRITFKGFVKTQKAAGVNRITS